MPAASRLPIYIGFLVMAVCNQSGAQQYSSEPAVTGGSNISSEVHVDTFDGNCRAFVNHLRHWGVTSHAGQTRPGTLGVTEFPAIPGKDENIAALQLSSRAVRNFREYDEAGIRRECLTGEVAFSLRFTPHAVITVAKWQADPATPVSCLRAWSAIENLVMRHERAHLDQMAQSVAELTSTTPRREEITACGPTLQEAGEAYRQKANARGRAILSEAVSQVETRYHLLADQYDRRSFINIGEALDCGRCEADR